MKAELAQLGARLGRVDADCVLQDLSLEAAERHGVSALLCQRASGELPRAWRDCRDGHVARGLRLTLELARVLAALESHGVHSLLLKGAALAQTVYEVPHQRPRGDTDLWIVPEQLEATVAALAGLGYRRLGWQSLDVARLASGACTLHGPSPDLVVDVHWRISNAPRYVHLLSFEEAFERRITLQGPLPASVLAPVHALLHACVHRQVHLDVGVPERLIWLVDIALLWRKLDSVERQEFWRLAAQRSAGAACQSALSQASGLFDLDFHAASLAAQATGAVPSRWALLGEALSELPSWQRRARALGRYIVPARGELVGLTGGESAAHYLSRALRGAQEFLA